VRQVNSRVRKTLTMCECRTLLPESFNMHVPTFLLLSEIFTLISKQKSITIKHTSEICFLKNLDLELTNVNSTEACLKRLQHKHKQK
jgi:hypothetical protein